MLLGWIRRGALGGLTLTALSACNGSSSSAPSTVDAAPVCPSSLYDSLSASCSNREVCSYIYPCGPFSSTATCACSGGHFSCTDVTGSPIAGDAGPKCLATEAGATGCPRTELEAQGSFCSLIGLSCPYPSACDSTPAYDTCQCAPDVDGGPTFRFACIAACELAPDASLQTDASFETDDSSTDSSTDAPGTEDAARDASMDAADVGVSEAGLDSSSGDARTADAPTD